MNQANTQPEEKNRHYRVYTSDVPNMHNLFERKTVRLYDDDELMPLTRGAIKFVNRISRSNVKMDSVDVPSDIISVIISYNPCAWYTVSKFCNKIATTCILQSKHIRDQWNHGIIYRKANEEQKVEMLSLFLRHDWVPPSNAIKTCSIWEEGCTRLLERESIRKQLPDSSVLQMLYAVPDLVIQYFDIRNMNEQGVTARHILRDSRKFDVIDKVYDRGELPLNLQLEMAINDYLQKRVVDTTRIRNAMNRLDPDEVKEIFDEHMAILGGENLSRLASALPQLYSDDLQFVIECYIDAYYIKGIPPLCIPENLTECIAAYFQIVNVSPSGNDPFTVLENYLLSVEDYSHIQWHNWDVESDRGKRMLQYLEEKGYHNRSSDSDSN